MQARDFRDIIGGLLLIAVGAAAAWYAASNYALGTVNRMGPGMFPAALGWILAGFGVTILVPALFRRGTLPPADLRAFATVIAGTMAFALIIDRLGFIAAIAALVVISSFADGRLGIVRALAYGLALSVVAAVIFRFGLGIPIHFYRWPF